MSKTKRKYEEYIEKQCPHSRILDEDDVENFMDDIDSDPRSFFELYGTSTGRNIKKQNKKDMEATNKITVKADSYDKNPTVDLIGKDTQSYQIESAGKTLVITQKGNARGIYPFKVIIKSERSGAGMMEMDLDAGTIVYTDKNGISKKVKWE